jgi:16S rRNA (uracil1498-N3)-methyltransferase
VARELRRLLISPERLAAAAPLLELSAAEEHYVRRVLRLRSGDRLELVDGAGGLWSAQLAEEAGRGAGAMLQLEQAHGEPLRREGRQPWPIRLGLAVPKRDPEVVWRMATELGVDQLQPLQAERTSQRGAWPQERWRTIVAEAAEQCERLWLPSLAPVQPARAWLAACGDGLRLLATTRHEGLNSLEQELASASTGDTLWMNTLSMGNQPISLAIGPEGGWSPAEEAEALEAGWRAVSLGPTILRSSTAAVAAVARLAAWREGRRLSCAASRTPST